MPTLTIRNVDAQTVQKLKQRAQQNGRSLEAELRTIVERASETISHDEFFRAAARIRATTRRLPGADGATLQRETREELAAKDDHWT